MVYKTYLITPVKGSRIDKKGDVKVYTPKRKAYKVDAKKGHPIPKELQCRFFLDVYKYEEAISLIDKLAYAD